MKTFPRLTRPVGCGLAVALAAGLSLFGQEDRDQAREAASERRDPGQRDEADGLEPASDRSGVELLREARENLIDKPLEARLEEDVILPNRQRFKASGRYVQGTGLKLRLEFQVKVGQSEGTLLEVCDGQILWTQQKVGERPRITRRDVRAILDAAAQAGHLEDNLLTAELGLGGLPALLASIEQHMDLEAPREETIDGQTVQIIEGRWNAEFLRRYLGATGDEAVRELPGNIPERVQIYLDAEKYPRRIVYRKRRAGENYDYPLLTLDFKDIRVNMPVAEAEFRFEPERGIFQEDITRQYLDRLRPAAR